MIFTEYKNVLKILQEHEDTRDSDERLYWHIIRSRGKNPDKITATQLLWFIHTEKLPSFEVVARNRRAIQKEHPELRGTRWNQRHDKQKQIKMELGQFRDTEPE